MITSHRRYLVLGLRLALTVSALWIIYWLDLINFSLVCQLLARPWLALGLAAFAWFSLPLLTYRWSLLLATQGIRPSFGALQRLICASSFSAYFLPGMMSGDALRMILGKSLSQSKWMAFNLSVLVDRAIGLLGLLFIGMLAASFFLVWGDPSRQVRFWALTATGGFGLGLALGLFGIVFARLINRAVASKSGPLATFLAQTSQSLLAYRGEWPILVKSFLISALTHGKDIFLLVLIEHTVFQGKLLLLEHALAGTVAFLANTAPVTPGGIGIGEAAYGQAMNMLGSPEPIAMYSAIMLYFRIAMLMAVLPGTARFLIAKTPDPATPGSL